jgi:ABC-2 type transport system permease protein/lipopolysaccharide transport system permease protein
MKYRKTSLGPLWLLVGPTMFVVFLGYLFSKVNSSELNVFVPHLAIGYITWTLISGFVTGGSTVFQKKRSEILQGNMRLTDVVLADNFDTFLHYLHQFLVIIFVFIYFKISLTLYSLVGVLGLLILTINGFWVTVFLGIVGARYRDLVEIVSSVMRIAFFVTPIIWIPIDGAGGALGNFLKFNPFYHFLELIRAPLLGNPIQITTWVTVLMFTVLGFILTTIVYQKNAKTLPLWI